jgi:TniQ
MLTVLPHPDELAKGHLGRWRMINCIPSSSTCMEVMRDKFEQSGFGSRSTPFLHVLATFSGLENRYYERHHSMMPFMSFAVKDNLRTADGGWTPQVARWGLLTPRKLAFMCPACIDEDKKNLGYSYWRRSHQLPSSFWCDKHPNERLHWAHSDAPFDRLPEDWLVESKTEVQSLQEAIREHPLFQKFEEACQQMLQGGSNRSVKLVRGLLCSKAHERGIATACNHNRPIKGFRFSDMVKQELPIGLLHAIWPSLLDKTAGAFYAEIDDAVRSGSLNSLGTGTALAISLLWGSTTTSFFEMDEVPKRPKPKNMRSTIKTLFVQRNGDLSMIAKDIDLSITATAKIILLHRQEIYRHLDQNLESQALKDFYDGNPMSIWEICKHRGANPNLVEKAIWLKCASRPQHKIRELETA